MLIVAEFGIKNNQELCGLGFSTASLYFMITIEEGKRLVLEANENRYKIHSEEETEWGFIFGWGGEVLGYGAALVDKDTGFYFQTGSKRKKQNVIEEFGRLMTELRGQVKEEKAKMWLNLYKTFEENPYF